MMRWLHAGDQPHKLGLCHTTPYMELLKLSLELSRPLERSLINFSDPNISHVILSQTLV